MGEDIKVLVGQVNRIAMEACRARGPWVKANPRHLSNVVEKN